MPSSVSSTIAPSGSLRAISCRVWAATVVAPARPTIAFALSITSMSRSVARKLTWSPSASISTFDRMGMVLRRSTTDCARLIARRRALRSMLSFMLSPLRKGGMRKGLARVPFRLRGP